MNPIWDSTTSGITATLQSLAQWRDNRAELLQDSMGNKSADQGAAARYEQWVSCAPIPGSTSIRSVEEKGTKEELNLDHR